MFDVVAADFNNSMFGLYSNSVTRDEFQRKLSQDGWKYFDLNNLNTLFSIKYAEIKNLEKAQNDKSSGKLQPNQSDDPLTSKRKP